ncbi:MAG: helix-turn-helix transcriptional regulator [Deltaproteobacteria bacterium]|nr:helix-turn-helix transcriptional regulator [Deltaproteobacteria bacterium]
MFLDPCIRRLRELKGWSVYRLAKEAGLSRSYLASIERGGNCSLETFAKLLGALGIQEAVLVRYGDGFRIALKEGALADSLDPGPSRTVKKRRASVRVKKR